MKVEKRDGTIQAFKFDKIEAAVTKVFVNEPVNEPVPDKFIEQLLDYFDALVKKQDQRDPNYAMPIEEIQNIIRDFLIKKNKVKAAEAFILYRKKREEVREGKSWLKKEIFRKRGVSETANIKSFKHISYQSQWVKNYILRLKELTLLIIVYQR